MPDIIAIRSARRRRSFWDLRREVAKQFFGSDLESGYAFIYVWLANQFGHFMIGFAGTILCGWIATLLSPFCPGLLTPDGSRLRFWPAVGIGFAWLLLWAAKELLYDVASALRNLRTIKAQREALRSGGTPPPPERRKLPNRQDLAEIWSALREFVTKRGRPTALPGEAGEEACLKSTAGSICQAC
jgi:hypothetical protein